MKNFKEWFAVRPKHSDEDGHISGCLTFDLDEGIFLDTIRFSKPTFSLDSQNGSGQTLTGWLDYQRPATLIEPLLQQYNSGTISMDTPAMRESLRFIAGAILKNVFLEDIKAPIFKGILIEHPAFNAWIDPKLVDRDWSQPDEAGPQIPSINVQQPKQRIFSLNDGTQAIVTSETIFNSGSTTELKELTSLELKFPQPVNFNAISRIVWRVSSLFEFLIGARLEDPAYRLPTTQTRMWNDKEHEVVAELWYEPIKRKKRHDTPPNQHKRFTVEQRSAVSLEVLLNHVTGSSDELIYLADQIQSAEDYDLPLTQGYLELLGCLEAFDKRTFGSGSDPNLKPKLESLTKLIEKNGTPENIELFSRIKGVMPNSFSLLKRLERLHEKWNIDSFRANPDLKRICKLRNFIPHGEGLKVSGDIAQEIVSYRHFLTALGRYHVLKQLGFSGDQVGTAFIRGPYNYGMFVPLHLISSHHEQQDVESSDNATCISDFPPKAPS